jgi:hypothetical protein
MTGEQQGEAGHYGRNNVNVYFELNQKITGV